MKTYIMFIALLLCATLITAQSLPQIDVYKTSKGNLTINLLGHATMYFEFGGKIIHVDPCGQYAKYDRMPKADIILITHQHQDHFDTAAIKSITKENTQIILTKSVFDLFNNGIVLANGEKKIVDGLEIEAVPAYNTSEGREKFHPKGRDNGYIIQFANTRVYIAGDTENIPEMADIKKIDIAFLPMNQPYTMLPKQVAEAALLIKPKVLYPYHFGNTDVKELQKLLENQKDIKVKIRKMN